MLFALIEKSNNNANREKKKAPKIPVARKPNNLKEIFYYPNTEFSLSIPSPSSSLYQADKASFKIYIMKISNSVSCCFPPNVEWLYSSMAAMRVLMPRETILISVLSYCDI